MGLNENDIYTLNSGQLIACNQEERNRRKFGHRVERSLAVRLEKVNVAQGIPQGGDLSIPPSACNHKPYANHTLNK